MSQQTNNKDEQSAQVTNPPKGEVKIIINDGNKASVPTMRNPPPPPPKKTK